MIFILSVCIIPALGFLLVQNNKVQNYLAQTVTTKLSGFLETKVHVGNVQIDMLNRLVIKKLYVEDRRHDTLLYANKLTLSIGAVNISKKIIRIERIELSKAFVNFYIDSNKVINLQFFINKIAGDTTKKKKGWNIVFNNIGLIDSRFALENYYKIKVDSGINFTNLKLSNLNIRVKNLETKDHVTSFKINKLYFKEQSGFTLNNLSAKMSLKQNFMHFDNLRIFTPASKIIAPKIYFDFNKFNDFSYFAQKVQCDFVLNSSSSSFSEIAYFTRGLWGMNEKFELSGLVKGKLNNLRCKKIKFSFGKTSIFEGDLSLTGLPIFQETYMFINVKNLDIYSSDINQIYFPTLKGNKFQIPKQFEKIGKVNFKGNFAGFVNDFVTYGTFKTDLGIIKSDLSLKPESKTKIAFDGKLNAIDFNVGRFFDNEKILGKANISINATGLIEGNKKVTGSFEGNINQFECYGYTYSDIFLKGSLQENAFDGLVTLEDPNVKLDLSGQIDLTKKIPEFNFSAKIINAELNKLQILKKDSAFNISCMINAKFSGSNINNIEGDIQLKEADLKKLRKELIIKDLSILAKHNQLSVKSDIIDANIVGEHDLSQLYSSLIKVFKNYMPSSFKRIQMKEPLSVNRFKFDAVFKNVKPFCDFFAENTNLAVNSRLNGTFYPSDSIINFSFIADSFQIGSSRFDGLNISCRAQKDSLILSLISDKFYFGNQVSFNRLMAQSIVRHDSMLTNIEWNNKDTFKNLSKIIFLTNFSKTNQASVPALNIKLFPAQVYIIDSLWKIDESAIILDTSSITVPNLKMSHNQQYVIINGKISENTDDALNFEFRNFDLRNLGFFLKSNQLTFEGKLSGHCNLSDYYHKSLFNADLHINRFSFNAEQLGNLNMVVTWNSLQQKIIAEANAYKSDYCSLHAEGEYVPFDKRLNFSFDVKNINLSVIQPILSNTFTLQKGNCSGHVELTGNIAKPYLNGSIDIDKATFMINYLKTNYSFTTKLRIVDNRFVFNNVKLTDSYNNQCSLDGMITNTYLKNFNVNFNINLDNTLVLNTKTDDNPFYYGKAFASGVAHISGPTQNINIDISHAKTGKNTFISIPLNNRSDIIANKFLTFNSQQRETSKRIIYKTAQYDVGNSGITLTLDLELTPEAEIQLVFDPKVGDIMRSQGNGNINIEINTLGNFNIRGDYTIQSGDYLFTLQNLINKKFILEPGGIISWNGNPVDASIDIKAIYRLRASLYNLIADPSLTQDYKKRIPIECQLFLNGKLLHPDIKYDIYLPNAPEEARTKVRDIINSEEELSKQFLMLLVTNNFMPDPNKPNSNNSTSATGTIIGRDIATTTSYEMLSNQFSNWISQVSKDFDIGFSYRPGDKNMTSEEVEVALSTQILNDRVTINGNLDVVGNQANQVNNNTNNLVGDVNVDVKLNESGKLMLKAFNRANDQLIIEQAPYTQGIGLLYREEFSTFGELMRKYYQKIFGKKKNQPVKQPADSIKISK